jgi:hypothetical protein
MSGKLILQHQDQHRVEKEETTIPLVPEIDQEIECPRCYETMVLSSDSDKLCCGAMKSIVHSLQYRNMVFL